MSRFLVSSDIYSIVPLRTIKSVASGQVSVWVPLLVAALGIVGVLGGQLVSAWREDRRWQREMKREDLRWQREQQRELQKQEHEARTHWRSERLSAYACYAEIMDKWSTVLVAAVIHQLKAVQIPAEDLDKMGDLNRQANVALTRILLVSSTELQAHCHDLLGLYGSSYQALLKGKAVLPGDKYPQDVISDAYFRLINDIRQELGNGPLDGMPHLDPAA